MKYCYHVSTGALSCYLDILDRLQKQISGTFAPTFTAYIEPLGYHSNVAS